jgi:hypothetical protein
MAPFLIGLALLFFGYAVYGRITEQAVRPRPERPTPAIRLADGMDHRLDQLARRLQGKSLDRKPWERAAPA